MSTCGRCGQPLDAWGEHYRACIVRTAPVHRPPTKPSRAPKPRVEPVFTEPQVPALRPLKRGSQIGRIFALISRDAAAPSSAREIAAALEMNARLVGIRLCIAARQGRLQRVGRGRFVLRA